MSLQDKEEMEARYGPPGSGEQEIDIPSLGHNVALAQVLSWLGVGFADTTPLDAMQLGDRLWAIRYYDRYDQGIYVLEFDDAGHILNEMHALLDDFVSDEEFYNSFHAVMTVY